MPHPRSPTQARAPALFDWDDDDASRSRRAARWPRGRARRVRAAARRDRGIRGSGQTATADRRRVGGGAHRGGAARRRPAVGCRGARPHPRRHARRAPRRRRRAGEARRRRGARARGARRSRARASTRSRSCCARCTAPACSSSPRAAGSSPSSGIRSSSRCSSTRSSPVCSRRTAGRGSPSGCTTVDSAPSTCPAASSPAAGRHRAAARCSCRASCASAVRADPGWLLVVADVAQLEPRVLAAMAGDRALADAARGRDLYAGIVDSGAVATRSRGEDRDPRRDVRRDDGGVGAARAAPATHVSRGRWASSTTPRASARTAGWSRPGSGARSPPPSEGWAEAQSRATEAEASGADETRARRRARDRGRFTRNFVVQGTAAEWALAWLADLRTRLAALPPVGADGCRRPLRTRLRAASAPRVLPARRGHRAHAGELRRRGCAGGAGGRGIRRSSALRRLPDRLPARRAHRASPRCKD